MEGEEWLERYRRAWESADPEAAAALFTDDAVYRSSPFREPHVGPDAIRDYWAQATEGQDDASVRFGRPITEGNRTAVEWWTTMRDGGNRDHPAGHPLPPLRARRAVRGAPRGLDARRGAARAAPRLGCIGGLGEIAAVSPGRAARPQDG